MNRSVDTVIVGGGISGAAALHWLARAGVDVLLVERESRLGGVIGSYRNELGALVETGPNSVQMNAPELDELIADLGLTEELLTADPAASNRYVMRGGRLIPVPTGPKAFLATPLFTAGAKLRMLRELFVPAAPAGTEESVAAFVERRLGREVLDYAVSPFVSGVYAGRPEQLSMRHAFPRLHTLEAEHGGLIRGMLARARAARKSRKKGEPRRSSRLAAFAEGMETLPREIARRWRNRLLLGAPVRSIEPAGEGWRVFVGGETIEARRVIIAADAATAAALIDPFDHEGARALAGIEYPPIASVVSLYARTAIDHPLDGFGLLIPERERRPILGTIFSSTLFPNRAPEGYVALTTFVGGARQPALAGGSREEIETLVHTELRKILGIGAKPRSVDVRVWRRAIPQYAIGYGAVIEAIERSEARLPGLHLLGNYRGGVSVGDCVRSAFELASAIVARRREAERGVPDEPEPAVRVDED